VSVLPPLLNPCDQLAKFEWINLKLSHEIPNHENSVNYGKCDYTFSFFFKHYSLNEKHNNFKILRVYTALKM